MGKIKMAQRSRSQRKWYLHQSRCRSKGTERIPLTSHMDRLIVIIQTPEVGGDEDIYKGDKMNVDTVDEDDKISLHASDNDFF